MNWKRSWVPILLAASLSPALALLAACASTSTSTGPNEPAMGPAGDSYTAAGTGGGFGLSIDIPKALRARHPVTATATLTNLSNHPLPVEPPTLEHPLAWVTARDARGHLEAWNLIPPPPNPHRHLPRLQPQLQLAPSQSLAAEVTLLPTTPGPIELAVDYSFISDPNRAFDPAAQRPKGLPLILHVVVR